MDVTKEELLKAAETLKGYCHKHKKNDSCDKYTCNLYYACMEFYDSDMEYAMGFITETSMDDETIG